MQDADPNKQISYIQQVLSSDKKPLGFFLGAGCSTAVKREIEGIPLIPDIKNLTSLIKDNITSTENKKAYEIILEHFEKDGRNNQSIEDILTHIRSLQIVAGKETVRDLTYLELEKLDKVICDEIQNIVNVQLPNINTPFHHIASWTNAITRDNPVQIFTTNYDLLMEQAFEECHVPYFDGFAGARVPFFDLRSIEEDSLPSRWARLWKLHGSINWHYVKDKGVLRGRVDSDIEGSKRVIHPSHLKYLESRRMPYLAMIDQLRTFLKTSTATLIICGYSFSDAHINEVLLQGLDYSHTTMVFALLYGSIENYPDIHSLTINHPNFSVLALDKAIISCRDLPWIEKDSSSGPLDDHDWINWIPVEGSGKVKAQFKLGDFDIFGKFIKDLTGNMQYLIGNIHDE